MSASSLISQVSEKLTRPLFHSSSNFFTVSVKSRFAVPRFFLHCMCRTNSWANSSAASPRRLILPCKRDFSGPFYPRLYTAFYYPFICGNFLFPMGVSPLHAQPRCLHLLQASQGVFPSVDNFPNAALTSRHVLCPVLRLRSARFPFANWSQSPQSPDLN